MTDQAPMSDELLSEIRGAVARGWCAPANSHKVMDTDLALAIADEIYTAYAARLRAGGEAVHFRYEMERMRSVNDHLSRVLTGIHALLYPPTHVVDGATMVFRPKGLDAHGLMQSLSDRIRAIPGELASYATPPRAPVAEGVERAAEVPAVDAPSVTGWNGRDTLPKDGTRIRILWSNGKEDVGYFMPLDYASPWIDDTRREHPEIYEHGGEWSTEFGEGDNSEFHPIGWLPLDAAIDSARAKGGST